MAKFLLALLISTAVAFGYDFKPNYDYISSCRFGPVGLTSRDIDPNTEFVRGMFQAKCQSCHYAGSPTGSIRFDDILNSSELISAGLVSPSSDPTSTVLYDSLIRSGLRMPLGGVPLDPIELFQVRQWISDGAPSFFEEPPPENIPFLSYGDQVLCIALDLAANVDINDAPSIRYLTLVHTANTGNLRELNLARDAMNLVLNSVSFNPRLVPPVAIDKYSTIFRIDLREYGIDEERDWNEAILAEYPYAVEYDDDVYNVAFDELFIEGRTDSERAYLHGDWFAELISTEPFYSAILFDKKVKNERDLLKFLGINEQKQIIDGDFKRIGLQTGTSGVSFYNRIIEKKIVEYSLFGFAYDGLYTQSFDFASDVGFRNIFVNPFRALDLAFIDTNRLFRHDASEHIFQLPSGMLGFFLADGRGDLIGDAQTNLVYDPLNNYPIIASDPANAFAGNIALGVSCMGCHAAGYRPVSDVLYAASNGGGAIEGTAGFSVEEVRYSQNISFRNNQDIAQTLTQASQTFVASLAKLEVNSATATSPLDQPVYSTVKAFLNDMSLKEAAAELYLTESEMRSLCFHSQATCEAIGLGDPINGRVSRANWDGFFGVLVDDFDLGRAVKLGGGGIYPPPPPPPPPPVCKLKITNASSYNWHFYQLKFSSSNQWDDGNWIERNKTNVHDTKLSAQLFVGTSFMYIYPSRYFDLIKCGKYKFITTEKGTTLVKY